jgi:RNA polymerase sigma-70 factor (ECF subfamily)
MFERARTDAAGGGREITAEDYRRLHPQLFAQILRLGIPRDEVEDLIQETFLHAQRALKREQFEGRSSLDTWIVSIAKKRTLKHHRRLRAAKRRGAAVPLDESDEAERGAAAILTSSEPNPQVQASDRQLLDRAILAVEKLPESFRAPLVLNVRGHTYEEIAVLLGIPMSRVTSRIHQARSKLGKNLSR